jgi:hypothetical protein
MGVSDWVCERCKSINRQRTVTCYSCGASRGAVPFGEIGGDATRGAGPAAAAEAGDSLADEALSAAAVGSPVEPAGASNLVGGVAGGLVAGAIGAGIWYAIVTMTEFQVGLVAVAVGWLVGQGVVLGARGRGSILLIPVSVVLTLLALATSEYLIVHHYISQEFVDVPFPSLELAIDFVTISIEEDPITLLFWGIALIPAVSVPWGLVSRSAG